MLLAGSLSVEGRGRCRPAAILPSVAMPRAPCLHLFTAQHAYQCGIEPRATGYKLASPGDVQYVQLQAEARAAFLCLARQLHTAALVPPPCTHPCQGRSLHSCSRKLARAGAPHLFLRSTVMKGFLQGGWGSWAGVLSGALATRCPSRLQPQPRAAQAAHAKTGGDNAPGLL